MGAQASPAFSFSQVGVVEKRGVISTLCGLIPCIAVRNRLFWLLFLGWCLYFLVTSMSLLQVQFHQLAGGIREQPETFLAGTLVQQLFDTIMLPTLFGHNGGDEALPLEDSAAPSLEPSSAYPGTLALGLSKVSLANRQLLMRLLGPSTAIAVLALSLCHK